MRPTRLLAATTAVMLLAGLSTALAAPATAAAQEDPAATAEQELKQESDGKVTVRRDKRGVVHFVGAEPGAPVQRPSEVSATASPARQAAGYLKKYEALWALDHRGAAVRATRTQERGKSSVVRFEQTVDGMPVLGGELAVALDADGDLRSVTGETTPLSLPDAELRITPAQAQSTALALAARTHSVARGKLRASTPEAYAYDPALLGPGGRPGLRPVWRVEVTGLPHVRHQVLVDRARGSVELHYNQVANNRVVCDFENRRLSATTCTTSSAYLGRAEGGAENGTADVDAAYDYLGDTRSFYADHVGIDLTALMGTDSVDGKRLRATVRYCLPQSQYPTCPMDNAFWNGIGVYLGDGVALSDDIVGHELTHGVVEKTANLAYWYQSGAINESMADIFGELMDLNNADAETETPWRLGEGSPFGVIRRMDNPPALGDPDRMGSPNYHGAPWTSNEFDNGGVHFNSGVGNKAGYLIARPAADGPVSFNGRTITGIGHTKAALVYYESLQLLTSGADYADLYSVLPQACQNLVAGGVGGITGDDCGTVSAAVAATEMNKQPSSYTAPEAPVCDSGTKQDLFADGFEGSMANWSRTSGMWPQIGGYARSGEKSMYGLEPARDLGEPATTYARLTKANTVPSGVKTYLRFDHQYLLAYDPGSRYWAGALLQYSVDGGKTFKSTSGLPWSNGPGRTIRPDGGTSYLGWGGDSHGYVSSRVDVSSLAGKSVMFRWRITSDPDFYLDGWTLDNVNLYLCGGATPSNVASVGGTGGLGQATIKWQPPVWPGSGGLTKYIVSVYLDGTRVQVYDDVSPDAASQLVTGLSQSRTYKFSVRPYSAAGGGASATKTLVGSYHVSSLSPTTIDAGQSTKFSGKLRREDKDIGIKGVTVTLQSRPKGSSDAWADTASTTTATYGVYSFTRKPTSSTEYRVQYRSGSTAYLGSTSAVRSVTVG